MSLKILNTAGGTMANVAGAAVVVPFSFGDKANFALNWDQAVACCHLVRLSSEVAAFESVSPAFFGPTEFGFAKDSTLFNLKNFEAKSYYGGHVVPAGDAVVVLRGKKTPSTTISDWNLPDDAEGFTNWFSGGENGARFTWGGDLGNKDINLKVSAVQMAIESGILTSIVTLGPCGAGTGFFGGLLGKGRNMKEEGVVTTPDDACGPLSKMIFIDKRREYEKSNLELFGNDNAGLAQVKDAHGAALLCTGSYAQKAPLVNMLALAKAASSGLHAEAVSPYACAVLPHFTLEQSMSESIGRPAASTVIFEGLALWDLKKRGLSSVKAPML